MRTVNEELRQANAELRQKLQHIVNSLDSHGRYLRLDKENANPHQHIEITQNVIEFKSPDAQVRTGRKSVTQTRKAATPHVKVASTFKDIITTLLN